MLYVLNVIYTMLGYARTFGTIRHLIPVLDICPLPM